MLPELAPTDVLQFDPDLKDVDPFGPLLKVPKYPGVYAFFIEGVLVYVGSSNNLHSRFNTYQTSSNKHSTKVRESLRATNVVASLWFTGTVGDALKYEYDTVLKYNPELNTNWCPSAEEVVKNRELRRKEMHSRLVEERKKIDFDPKALKTCAACRKDRPCSEYRRNSHNPLGVVAYCRQCEREERQRRVLSGCCSVCKAPLVEGSSKTKCPKHRSPGLDR